MRGARLQCVKTMVKLIVGILLVSAKITFIGFDLIFALRRLLFAFVEAPVKSSSSAFGYVRFSKSPSRANMRNWLFQIS